MAQIPVDVRKSFLNKLARCGVNAVYSWDEAKQYVTNNCKGLQSVSRIAVILNRAESKIIFDTRVNNRKTDDVVIRDYKKKMNLGDVADGWRVTHDFNGNSAILIDENFLNVAGQHRLLAHSLCDVEYLVFPMVFNASEESRLLQDKIKARSKNDEVAMFFNHDNWGNQFTECKINSVGRLLYLVMNNRSGSGTHSVSAKQIAEATKHYALAWQALFALVPEKLAKGHILDKMNYIAALLFVHDKMPQEDWEVIVAEFLVSIGSGNVSGAVNALYTIQSIPTRSNPQDRFKNFLYGLSAIDALYSSTLITQSSQLSCEAYVLQKWQTSVNSVTP